MFCSGSCGRLWHQNCYRHRIIYPGDDTPWYCDQCQLQVDEAREAEESGEARRVSRLPRMKKITCAGACKDVTRVDGKPAEGLVIADPRENHLTAATWVTRHTRGGGAGTGRAGGHAGPSETVFKVGDDVKAKWGTYGMYEAHITRDNGDGTFVVEFDDDSGDIDYNMEPKNMIHV